MKKIFELFLTFFKIGLFTFGGGYAMLAIIENNCVEEKKWITHDEMMNVTVIAESTPGPISINCATYVGYRYAGIWGAIAATLGVVLPSFIIIYFISMFLDNFLEIKLIANAFAGIQVAVGILIVNAAINMIKKMKRTPFSIVVVSCAAAAMLLSDIFALNFSTIAMLIIAAVVSIAVTVIGGLAAKKDGEKK